MAEAVKVIVRCRPMNEREKGLKCSQVVDIDGQMARCSITNPDDRNAPPKTFTFDGAYDIASTTEQIYADIGFPLVEVIFYLYIFFCRHLAIVVRTKSLISLISMLIPVYMITCVYWTSSNYLALLCDYSVLWTCFFHSIIYFYDNFFFNTHIVNMKLMI